MKYRLKKYTITSKIVRSAQENITKELLSALIQVSRSKKDHKENATASTKRIFPMSARLVLRSTKRPIRRAIMAVGMWE
jgi:hypothetical protein